MADAAVSGAHPLDTMLAVSDVITNDRYAQIYARVLALETPTVEELAAGLDSSTTTVYEDVNHLVESEILERVTETQPHRYRAQDIDLRVEADETTDRVTPTFLVALAKSDQNENLQLYLERHGRAGLATALDYARDYVRGRMNARLMAREQEIPVLEAETVLQELREILLEVEPDLQGSLDIDDLDAAVDDVAEE